MSTEISNRLLKQKFKTRTNIVPNTKVFMLLLSPEILNTGTIHRQSILQSLMRKWSQLLNSNNCNILNKPIKYRSIELVSSCFYIVVELTVTDYDFSHSCGLNCVGVDWHKISVLYDVGEWSIGLNELLLTPLNFNNFLELKAMSGLR